MARVIVYGTIGLIVGFFTGIVVVPIDAPAAPWLLLLSIFVAGGFSVGALIGHMLNKRYANVPTDRVQVTETLVDLFLFSHGRIVLLLLIALLLSQLYAVVFPAENTDSIFESIAFGYGPAGIVANLIVSWLITRLGAWLVERARRHSEHGSI